MPTDQSGAGDPARTLRLLWRTPETGRRRGPRHGLTVDQIAETAINLADAGGLPAVTMRRLAQDLGVVAMSLYTYVPGKAELLDLMLDTVYGQMRRVAPRPDAPWRERVEAIAEENRALCERHPWVAQIGAARPVLGPGQMAKYEHELRAFEGLGLDDVEMDAALTYLLSFVQASARAAAQAAAARRDSAMSDERWWEANAPLLARVLDESAYPTAVRVGSAAGGAHHAAYSAQHAYAFGLARVLDGLGALIERGRPAR